MSVAVPNRSSLSAVGRRTFRVVAQVVSTRQADATVLLDLHRGLCFSLNELGWRIWDLISAGEAMAAVVTILRQEYDLPRDSFEADVAGFVDYLLRASLIEPVERRRVPR